MRIAIVGVGLIGGSIGLAARGRLGATVSGWSRSRSTLDRALELGVLDRAGDSLADAVRDAEAVFVCAPVGVLPDVVRDVLAAAPQDCVITDAGSTKRSVVEAIEDPRFVGGHPLAGAETAGVEHARADLFQDATWYLTPTPGATGVLFERLHRLIRELGARPATIDAATHDTMLAAVSHLPHVFANVLVAQAATALGETTGEPASAGHAAGSGTPSGGQLPATGPSFRDATRVAGANSAIWTDIYLANRDALIEQMDGAIERLRAVRAALTAADPDAVTAWNDAAAADRRRLLEAQLAGGPLHELRVSVPNEPGVVATLALELARAGVNITDMALYPAPDHSEGVVALWIAGDEPAARAESLVAERGHPVARA
ncbi:MAG TPA: prephenate dehydrogenase/arogenate dehydrogenase family protein [Conexibacter sp.]|nr:prephenate dehydrogenase/arogenate dehydrogenase family protein [Conexibacter sp.]